MTIGVDLRDALRSLRLRPGWTAAAVLTLAAGIGANATMFSLVDRLLVRPPPHVSDPGRVVRLSVEFADRAGGRFAMSTTSYPVFADLQRSAHSFAALAAVAAREMVLGTGADARAVQAAQVSGAYFSLLGAVPAAGRFFGEAEDQPPLGEPVAVISYALWRRESATTRATPLGPITLDGSTYQVIGVAPPDFTGDDVEPVEVWVPLHAGLGQGAWTDTRGLNLIRIVGRLANGVAPAIAAQESSALARVTDPSARVLLTSLAPGWAERSTATVQGRVALWVAAMSVVVLLVAIVNVTNLMLLRGEARRREVAVRLALGATPRDLARALLVESLVLAVLAGGVAAWIAAWGGEAIRATLLPNLAAPDRLLSPRLIWITTGATVLAGALSGLVPALRAIRPAAIGDLRSGGAVGRSGRGTPGALLVAQGGLCMVLLIAASLFVLSLHRVRNQDFGFRSAGVLLATLRFSGAMHGPAQDAVYREAEARVGRLPGVELASVVGVIPFVDHHVPPIAAPGREEFPDERQQAPFLNPATPAYFRVLGMTIRQGRNFTAADGAGSPLVIIINEAMADGLWPGESALGRCIRVGFVPGEMPSGIHASAALPCRQVVGVVSNARPRSIRAEAGQALMQYYVPFGQIPASPFAANPPEIRALLIRTADADAMARTVQRSLQSFTPYVRLADVTPFQDVLDRQMRPWLLGATLFSVFGLLALGLAAIGLYGARAYAVAQRTREIGIRMALGAGARTVVAMVLREGLRIAGTGIAVGTAVALGVGRFIEPLLFETRADDPRLFAVIAGTLVVVALGASWLPAWRAARVDPNVALRAE
jgi:predicted permease